MDGDGVLLICVAGLVGLVSLLTALFLSPILTQRSYKQLNTRSRRKQKLKSRNASGVVCTPRPQPQETVRHVVSTGLHTPCKRCREVNAKKNCRYNCCATCCRAEDNSICRVHCTGYNTCSQAATTAYSLTYSHFDISYAHLKLCPPQVPSIGPQLISLNLSNNRLEHLPHDLGRLSGLEELFLQYNRLSLLPESLCLCTRLVELDVKNNLLTRLPDGVGGLRALLTLNLTNNCLKALPREIGSLISLEELCVHGNQLSHLPHSLPHLSSLKMLYAGENLLTSLPTQFGRLCRLEELDLSDCCLVSIPESLTNCKRLVRLWLSGNKLTSLPHNLGHLQALKELHLRNNSIKYFPSSVERLNLYTFTAQNNSLYSESEATTFSKKIVCCVPPLLELCLRAAVQWGPFLEQGTLPQHLYNMTSHATLNP
ncbi:malignant fibrous histiocytoma-amplified sequence 1 homolog isoform X2 [Halichondria panicea]|uniref:malignant fibrous histiocytoma-amplified sequence 1 homolog isoform X2 n=1 Tax=Halichondria panicea TaxID=6063 RepID=UPI00312B798F